MRAVLMFIAIAVLAALIVFAPQGLLTKPHYSEGLLEACQLVYTTVPTGMTPDSVRSEMVQAIDANRVSLVIPLVVQPSLAAVRGEVATPQLTGFLVETPLDSTTLASLPYSYVQLESQPAMRAEFPYRGFLSIPLGDWKINERVRKRAAKKSWQHDQLIQLLDREGETLVYLVPEKAVDF
ncbi:hypothetical protein KQI63_04150 [bacterium]|nr:hypothetical protein [bacterium]